MAPFGAFLACIEVCRVRNIMASSASCFRSGAHLDNCDRLFTKSGDTECVCMIGDPSEPG